MSKFLICLCVIGLPRAEKLPYDILSCQREGYADWYDVLRYGKYERTFYQEIDRRERRLLLISYDKRFFVFVFDWPETPGVRVGSAWHGCGLYEVESELDWAG